MKVNKILLPILAAILCLFTACNDDDIKTIIESPLPEGEGAYFSKAEKTTYSSFEGDGIISIPVYRTKTDAAASVGVSSEVEEGANSVFAIPSEVTFNAGSNVTALLIPYKGAEFKKTYSIALTVNDGTPYAPSKLDIKFTYADAEVWTVVTKKGVFIENIMSAAFGTDQQKFENVTVEKLEGRDLYRFKTVFDNDYPYNETGDYLGVTRYITLDLETYSTADQVKVFVPLAKLGHDWGYGEFAVGSIAYNTSNPESSYPLGTYDKDKKMFDLGKLLLNLPSEGAFPAKANSYLYLDPSLIKVDYNADFTWSTVNLIGSEFYSSLFDQGFPQDIEAAKEDPTLFRLPDLYYPGYNFIFTLDKEKGLVSAPAELEMQNSGIVYQGNELYVTIEPSSRYDAEKGIVFFSTDFYSRIPDAEDPEKATYELTFRTIEELTWGKDPQDMLDLTKTEDDFVGKWDVPFISMKDGSGFYNPITIIKTEKAGELSVSGLSLMSELGYEFDDVFNLVFDNGMLLFQPQIVDEANFKEDDYYIVAPINHAAGRLSDTETLLGGMTKDGEIIFFNAPGNTMTYTAMSYFNMADKIYLLTGYVNLLEWLPSGAETQKTKKFSVTPFLERSVMPVKPLERVMEIKAQPTTNAAVYSKTKKISKEILNSSSILF